MHPSVLAELLFLFAMLAFLIRRFTIARRREERWEGALEAARQVQQVLLPEAIPHVDGFAIDCIYRPAEIVGGDFFQILPAGDGGLLVVIGDVAGKGLPAAMMVSMLVGAVRTEVAHEAEPSRLLATLNERMTGRSQASFTTCLCARVSADGQLEIANAGHPAPYCNGRELDLPGALPLGVVGGASYETTVFTLAPGDFLTFLSDGVIEAQDKAGRLLGFDQTQALSKQPAVEIAEAASLFGQVDDITVVSIAYRGSEVNEASVAKTVRSTTASRNGLSQEPIH
jgi:serine phosphatase RsbU (regulator of sigma subunit)